MRMAKKGPPIRRMTTAPGMTKILTFQCTQCGTIHEGSPSFSFDALAPYLEQSQKVRDLGHLDADLCKYEEEDGRHFFIRACLEIPIHGVEEGFLWGVWVALSEAIFRRFVDTYDAPDPSDPYFGWFCNYLPYYPDTDALKTQVHPQVDGARPRIEVAETDHLLSIDFHHGISIARAQEISEAIIHG